MATRRSSRRRTSNSSRRQRYWRGLVLEPLEQRRLLTELAWETQSQLPLSFEPNQGQTDPQVQFLSRGSGYTLFLTPGEAVLSLSGPSSDPLAPAETSVLRMQLAGADPAARVEGLDTLLGKSNYFVGDDPAQWRTDVPLYAKVRYYDVYPGVDQVCSGNQGQLEYDFIVAPGGNPDVIRMSLQGADSVEIDASGNLVLHTASGDVIQRAPIAYQEIDSVRQPVEASYALQGNGEVAFQVGTYDASQPLTIDPVLTYSTYLGGSGNDQGNGIAVDATGAAYVTGVTGSVNFPTTTGSVQLPGAFAPAFKTTDSGATWTSSANGLPQNVNVNSIVVDPGTTSTVYAGADGVYKSIDGGSDWSKVSSGLPTGITVRTLAVTPATLYAGASGLYKSTNGGASWALTGLGTSYSVVALAVDSSAPSTIYAATTSAGVRKSTDGGATWSSVNSGLPNLYISALAMDPQNPLTLYAAPSSRAVYRTINGGSSWTSVNSFFPPGPNTTVYNLAVSRTSPSTVYATTYNVFYSTTNGGATWSTLGAPGGKINAVAIDPVNPSAVYAATNGPGISKSTDGGSQWNRINAGLTTNFPLALGIAATSPSTLYAGMSFQGLDDVFVTKLSPDGSSIVYSAYLGGGAPDTGVDIAVDSSGNSYVSGTTRSFSFPTVNAFQPTHGGGANWEDAFVAKLSPTGNALVYSTYLGGGGDDHAAAVAVDASGNAYVTGDTGNTSNNTFPTRNAYQNSFGPAWDAFVTVLNPLGDDLVYSTFLGGIGYDVGLDVVVDSSSIAYAVGAAGMGFPTTANTFQRYGAGGTWDAYLTKIDPFQAGAASVLYSTFLGGAGDDSASGVALDVQGNVYLAGSTGSNNFPLQNAVQTSRKGNNDAFVAQLHADGSSLAYSTYLGGTGSDGADGIAVDLDGNAYVTGSTSGSGFPVQHPLQATFQGSYDAFVTMFYPGGSLAYSTYLGSWSSESGADIAVDSSGAAYVTGSTSSTSGIATPNAFQPTSLGTPDAFVAKISAYRPPVAAHNSYTVQEDQTLSVPTAEGVLANDTDVDDDVLSAVLVSDVSYGVLSFNPDSSFTYFPQPDYFGTSGLTRLRTRPAMVWTTVTSRRSRLPSILCRIHLWHALTAISALF